MYAVAARAARVPAARSSASGLDCPYSGSPVVDIIEVSVSTRSGCSIAIVWAIIPPIDAPTTCARSIPSAVSRPKPSSAMSLSVYGASRRAVA